MDVVKAADLAAGDVLLFHGNGLISEFIRLFDGSQYSHAAIYDGTNVVEAEAEEGKCVRVDSVAVSLNGNSYAHVYRFVSSTGDRFGSQNLPIDPVLAQIKHFEDAPEQYAYSQILLLGILLATRRVPLPGMSYLLRPFMDEAADKLNELFNGQKQVIICSELVYQCFNNVGEPEYQIEVAGVDPDVVAGGLSPRTTLMPSATPESDDTHLQKDGAAFLATYRAATNNFHGFLFNDPKTDEPRAIPAFVTPRDLAMSPNLTLIGQLALS
jgi:hypothetical protein